MMHSIKGPSSWWSRAPDPVIQDPTIPPFTGSYGVSPTSLNGQQLVPVTPDEMMEFGTLNGERSLAMNGERSMRMYGERNLAMNGQRGMTAGDDMGRQAFTSSNLCCSLPKEGDARTTCRPTEQQIYEAIKALEEANKMEFESGGQWHAPLLPVNHRLRKLDPEYSGDFYVDTWDPNEGPPAEDSDAELAGESTSEQNKKPSQADWDKWYANKGDFVAGQCQKNLSALEQKNTSIYTPGSIQPSVTGNQEPKAQNGQPDKECPHGRAPPQQGNPTGPGTQFGTGPEYLSCRQEPPPSSEPTPPPDGKAYLSMCPLFHCPPASPCNYMADLIRTGNKDEGAALYHGAGLKGTEHDATVPGTLWDPNTRLDSRLFEIPGHAMHPNQYYQCPFTRRRILMGPVILNSGLDFGPGGPFGSGNNTLPIDITTKPFPCSIPEDSGSQVRPGNRKGAIASALAPVLMMDVLRDIQAMNINNKEDSIIIDYDALPKDPDGMERLNTLKASCRLFKYNYSELPGAELRPCYMDEPKYHSTGCAQEACREKKRRDNERKKRCGCPDEKSEKCVECPKEDCPKC